MFELLYYYLKTLFPGMFPRVAAERSQQKATFSQQPKKEIKMPTTRSLSIILAVIALFAVTPYLVFNLWENLDASNIMVIQSPFSGELTVHTDPGVKWQGFGKVTTYPRRDQYSFSASKDQGGSKDLSIKTGFNDGGNGHVSGVMSWEMPLKVDAVIRLHKEYSNFHAIDQQLIRPMLEKVIFSAGATMSSIESSSERRPELPQTIDDQLQNGPYLTKVTVRTVTDPLTKQEIVKKTVEIASDKDGHLVRSSASTIKEYGISLAPVTINDIFYDKDVQAQIAERQKSTQAVQLSVAMATKAAQDAITTEANGKAKAATAKWDQETIKAKFVTEAQQKLEVATLAAQEAVQYKKEQILRGEGDAERRKLVMAADGALDKKLEAYVAVNASWADAFSKYNYQMVPSVVSGGTGANQNALGNASAFTELLTVKAARDLGIEMNMGNKNKK